jgi:hypothetical protein
LYDIKHWKGEQLSIMNSKWYRTEDVLESTAWGNRKKHIMMASLVNVIVSQHAHTYIQWIQNLVEVTRGCGASHEKCRICRTRTTTKFHRNFI